MKKVGTTPLKPTTQGFTLVELMVAMTVLSVMMVGVVISMQGVQNAWQLTRSHIRENLEGRRALETVVSALQRATLNKRWEVPTGPNGSPITTAGGLALQTESDLHFVSGPARDLLHRMRGSSGHAVFFQGAFGFPGSARTVRGGVDTPRYQSLPTTLNAWGYYVEFARDPLDLPNFMTSPRMNGAPAPPRKQRFRLMEYRQPTHELPLFAQAAAANAPALATEKTQVNLYRWFEEPVFRSQSNSSPVNRRTTVVAENILALIVLPHDPQVSSLRGADSSDHSPYEIAPNYLYDSRRFQWEEGTTVSELTRHRLPPAVEVVIVALAEDSWENISEPEAIRQGEELLGQVRSSFLTAANFHHDLERLKDSLSRMKLSFTVMSQVINLKG